MVTDCNAERSSMKAGEADVKPVKRTALPAPIAISSAWAGAGADDNAAHRQIAVITALRCCIKEMLGRSVIDADQLDHAAHGLGFRQQGGGNTL